MADKIICSRCHHEKNENEFTSIRGGYTKACLYCRNKNKSYHKKCLHKIRKSQCKSCSDSKKIIIENMVKHSKYRDIKSNLYDPNNFIDKCFIKALMDESMNCHYCQIVMQLVDYDDTLVTIERIDNQIGHIKSNCILACKACNCKRVGQA